MFLFSCSKYRLGKKYLRLSVLAATALSFGGCDLATNYTKADRGSNMEMQDFRDGLAERLPEVNDSKSSASSLASIPDLQPYVSTTSSKTKPMPLVSVSVNQTVPLRDVFFELAQQAKYDIELDPNIKGSVIFVARDKPLDEVVERICDIAGLKFKIENNYIRIENDNPYNQIYKLDFLSFVRSNNGGVNSSISVVSGAGAESGSNFSATSASESDFWAELDLNLKQLLGNSSSTFLKTKKDPKISAVDAPAPVQEVAATDENGNVTSGEGVAAPASPAAQPDAAPQQAVLKVESLPTDDQEEEGNASNAPTDGPEYTFSLNKQAGIITVFAPQKVQKKVDEYLKELKKSIGSQVLVEAKVFEVSLNDEYINGIEWQALKFPTAEGLTQFASGVDSVIGGLTVPNGSVATTQNFAIGYAGNDVQAFIQAISGFGTVRALASPRLTVMNNQSAVLNVATNRVFFDLDVERKTDDDTNVTTYTVDSEINSVPEGVLINVQPSVNLTNNTISLFVRPTVTKIVGTVADPGVLFVAGDTGIESNIPEVNVQEIDTVVQVRSGQPIVMGGLLQDKSTVTQQGIPVLGEVPVLGAAFRNQKDLVQKTELVIFLKATVINSPDDTIHNTDRDLYKTFSGDRRPMKL